MPHSPPAPASATWAGGSDYLIVTFDRVLEKGVLDFGNWTARHTNVTWTCTAASAAGRIVTCTMLAGVEDPGAQICHYAPPPFDVLSAFGIPAAAFSDFPIT